MPLLLLKILGFAAAILVGLTLGLIGGGGSILSVPVFVYIFGIEPVLATAYSLFVVGISSSIGAFSYMKRGLLNYKTALVFVVPSFGAVLITRRFLLPAIPGELFTLGQMDVTTDLLFMLFLVLVMLGLSLLTLNLTYRGNTKHFRIFLLVTPAALMVFVVRQFILPLIPHNLFMIGGFTMTRGIGIMLLFSMVMIAASVSMIRGRNENSGAHDAHGLLSRSPVIVLLGMLVGTVTGLVGAGGGFLIIPSLVIIAGLPMKTAVGTSLMIIAVNSLMGFLGDIRNESIDWIFLLAFTALAIIGIFVGTYVSRFVDGSKLKKGFGWFTLGMGIYILLKESWH